jgi:hypothetical protein
MEQAISGKYWWNMTPVERSLAKLKHLPIETDWILRVTYTFTTTMKPVAMIYREDTPNRGYSALGNTIEEAVELAVQKVLEKHPPA